MELNEHALIEEFLALRGDTCWGNTPTEQMNNELFSKGWPFDGFLENPEAFLPNLSLEGFSMPLEQDFNINPFNEPDHPLMGDQLPMPKVNENTSNNMVDLPHFPVQEAYSLPFMEEEEAAGLVFDNPHNLERQVMACKMEPTQSPEFPVFSSPAGSCLEPRSRPKKLNGQPSKNLMAERRRRKRLNDRLSMLRSIVPKISKMDRTSILGDTIDYVKELMEKINNLKQEIEEGSSNPQSSAMSTLNDIKENEIIIRNSPKFAVERRDECTRIEICCSAKPGLLLSTVNTLEALGLEIEQCVISCFNDFTMQASCSEVLEQRTLMSSEEIKQALFENTGYGGRCL